MTCPKCGAKIEDGMLLCSKCGYEIKYVPNFDPEIENSIEESLSNVAAEVSFDDDFDEELLDKYGLGEEDSKRLPTQEMPVKAVKKRIPTQEINQEKIRKITDEHKKSPSKKPVKKAEIEKKKPVKSTRPKSDDDLFDEEFPDDFWDVEEALDFTGGGKIFKAIKNSIAARVIAIIAGLVLVGVVVAIIVFVSGRVKRNSFEYKYQMAHEAYANGDYAHAVSYMESAANMHSDDLTVQYELAEYYQKNNQTQNAVLTYLNIIRDFDTDILIAYTRLFAIYESQGDFGAINNVLAECNDPDIINQFQQYLSVQPEFSLDSGSYDDPIYLKITANPTGKIYYTMDGSTPDNESMEYNVPLYLEKGSFQIKAVYINSFGLMSPIAEGEFQINVAMPDAPTINLDSGEFEHPELIEVLDIPEDCVVYYTTDGSEPTKDSNVYKNPILMPTGSSTFQFVTYNFDDVPSEIVTRDYLFLIDEKKVTAATAANQIMVYRFITGNGTLSDVDGTLTYLNGRLLFTVEAGIVIKNTDYFVVVEYFQDGNANTITKTGYLYAVSTKDENDYGTLKVNANGAYEYTRVTP